MMNQEPINGSNQPPISRWSRPPQGNFDIYRGLDLRFQASLGKCIALYAVLTYAVMYATVFIVFSENPQSVPFNQVLWFLPFAGGFYLYVGTILIPIVALFRVRTLAKTLTSILWMVNLYIIASYLFGAIYALLSIIFPVLNAPLPAVIACLGLGYIITIIAIGAIRPAEVELQQPALREPIFRRSLNNFPRKKAEDSKWTDGD